MIKFIAAILALTISGCASADLIMTQYKPYKGGTVKYLSGGANFLVEKRRRAAIEKMNELCGGPYEIMGEGENTEGIFPYSSTCTYIQFKCADQPPQQAAKSSYP